MVRRVAVAGVDEPRLKLDLQQVYERLLDAYGRQGWWPAQDAFEVMVGAILTQNTSWTQVEKVISALRGGGLIDAAALLDCEHDRLAGLLRPVGYFNVKARRLQNFCGWYLRHEGEAGLSGWSTEALREALLSVNGVGAETADAILLYAFERPVFVIDAYTRRLFGRLGLLDAAWGYEVLRASFERDLRADVAMFNEYHALIVHHAKYFCRSKPHCAQCALAGDCPAAPA